MRAQAMNTPPPRFAGQASRVHPTHRGATCITLTEHAIVTLQSFRNSFMSSLGLGRTPSDMPSLRSLCAALVADVPLVERTMMLERLQHMRRADDIWHLRTALFDTISRAHGESTARERLARLDAELP
jgi:hypothetical protein